MSGPRALLLPADPLEAYVEKFGSIPDQRSLTAAGTFDHAVVAYQGPRGGRSRPRPGLTVYRIRAFRCPSPAALRGAAFALSLVHFVAQVVRVVLRERVDVIRSYSPFVPGAAAVIAGRLTGRPSIVAVHTDPEEVLSRLDRSASRVLRGVERFTLPRADRVWCVTRYLREVVRARGVPVDRINVAPNRVPVDAFASPDAAREAETRTRWAIPKGTPVVVAVGRLDPEKDPLTLVKAFALTGHREARLVLVGDGALRDAVEEEGRRAGLDGRLVLTGFRPRDEIASFLHVASCFVLASRYEGFPHALVEALAAGVPVVASDAPQMDELLAGTGALRFPAGDAAALAARLRDVLVDPGGGRLSAARGRATAGRYELRLVDAAEAALYRELLMELPREAGGRR